MATQKVKFQEENKKRDTLEMQYRLVLNVY